MWDVPGISFGGKMVYFVFYLKNLHGFVFFEVPVRGGN